MFISNKNKITRFWAWLTVKKWEQSALILFSWFLQSFLKLQKAQTGPFEDFVLVQSTFLNC